MSQLEAFHKMAREAGRDPAELEVSIYGARPDEEWTQRRRDAGIARVVYFTPSSPRDEVLPLLDRYAKLASSVG